MVYDTHKNYLTVFNSILHSQIKCGTRLCIPRTWSTQRSESIKACCYKNIFTTKNFQIQDNSYLLFNRQTGCCQLMWFQMCGTVLHNVCDAQKLLEVSTQH